MFESRENAVNLRQYPSKSHLLHECKPHGLNQGMLSRPKSGLEGLKLRIRSTIHIISG